MVAFGLDFALLLWPLIVTPWVSISTPFPKLNMVSFALAHAISLTAAIAWAICPKAVYDFALPSPGRLPIPSYIVFGALSYLTGVIVWTGLRLLIQPIPGWPMAEHPVRFILINSLAFLFMTVCMSVLIDVRLRTRSYDHQSNRWRDAIVLALALLVAAVIFQLALAPYMPPGVRLGTLTSVYLGLTFAIGCVLGFSVPSVASAYLQADEIIAKQIPSEADLLTRIKSRKSADALISQAPDGAAVRP